MGNRSSSPEGADANANANAGAPVTGTAAQGGLFASAPAFDGAKAIAQFNTDKGRYLKLYANALENAATMKFLEERFVPWLMTVPPLPGAGPRDKTPVMAIIAAEKPSIEEWRDYNLCLYSVLRNIGAIKGDDITVANVERPETILRGPTVLTNLEVIGKLAQWIGPVQRSAEEAVKMADPLKDKFKNGLARNTLLKQLVERV